MFHRNRCPICDSERASVYDDSDQCMNKRCLSCGTVYLASKTDGTGYSGIYDDRYYKSTSHQFGYENYKELRRAIHTSAQRRFARIERLMRAPSGSSVLDVGCACGYYLEAAKERGWRIQGIDISDWAVTNADKETRPFLICDDILETTKIEKNHFDCATLWDVIEQTPEPRRLVSKVRESLKPGGMIALMFRDIDSVLSRALKRNWIHYRSQEKYVYLTNKSARLLLEKEGFKLKSIECANTGKDTTIANLSEKVEVYCKPLAKAMGYLSTKLRFQDTVVYINFFDTRIAYAEKL